MAQAKKVSFAAIFLSVALLLNGCAAAMLVGGEAAGAVVYSGHEITGAELREIANWSSLYDKKVETKVRLERSDWTCARGRGMYAGQEYCLPPEIAGHFGDKDWFVCSSGRGGGVITKVLTRDYANYCESKNKDV